MNILKFPYTLFQAYLVLVLFLFLDLFASFKPNNDIIIPAPTIIASSLYWQTP